MELMHRHSAGLKVWIAWDSEISEPDTVEIICQTALAFRSAVVPAEKALDAFTHPCVYVDDANALFREEPRGYSDESEADDPTGGVATFEGS